MSTTLVESPGRTYPNPLAGSLAAVIKERGWCQDTSLDGSGRVCVYGAASFLASQEDREAASGLITEHIGNGIIRTALNWNDAEGRTVDEVLDALAAIPA